MTTLLRYSVSSYFLKTQKTGSIQTACYDKNLLKLKNNSYTCRWILVARDCAPAKIKLSAKLTCFGKLAL